MPSLAVTARGLVGACHPLPCVAVTGFVAAWSWAVATDDASGRRLWPTALLVVTAVAVGQLSIGWSNDAVDAERDRAVGRTDKPVVTAGVAPTVLWRAALAALVLCVAASVALGPLAAAAHLTGVAAGWTYNLWAKRTPLSFLPYVVAFGLLPTVATGALRGEPADVATGAASALLGVAAHFANTVADSHADALTGVRGLPQRWGPRWSMVTTAVLVAAAAGCLVVQRPAVLPGVLLVAAAVVAAGTALVTVVDAARARAAFTLTLVAVGLVVAGFVLTGP